jgi:hypothetical protein
MPMKPGDKRMTTPVDYEFVITSEFEQGYWHNKKGWVYDAKSATKFVSEDAKWLRLPHTPKRDSKWVPFTATLPDFSE